MKKLKVCWISGGVSSLIAGYLAKDVDKLIYIHVENQHPDTLRFVKECAEVLGKELEILEHPLYKSVEDVIRKFRFINSPYGARCTRMLKKEVRHMWEKEHADYDITYVWGFDRKEIKRAYRMVETFPEVFENMAKLEREIGMSCIKGVFLDELDPARGRMEKEIIPDCGVSCYHVDGN